MNIAYIANPDSIHNAKWINHFAEHNNVYLYKYPHNSADSNISNKVNIIDILPSSYPLLNIIKRKKILQQIRQHIRTNNIQIVHSMYAIPNAFWGDEIKIIPHIITTRGSDVLVEYAQDFQNPKTLRQHYIYPAFQKKLKSALKNAKFITSTSKRQQTVISSIIKNTDKLKLVRTGVTIKKYENFEIKKQKNIIQLFSPRGIAPIYNTILLLNSIKHFTISHPNKNIHLRLASHPRHEDYLQKVKAYIEKNNLKNKCEILEKCNESEMLSEYKNADIVIMIPKSDGTPVSGIETMLSKTPLIMGNIEYDDDLFNKDTIWQLSSITPQSITDAINEIISLDTQNLAKKLNIAKKNAIEYASLDTAVKTLSQYYQQIINA